MKSLLKFILLTKYNCIPTRIRYYNLEQIKTIITKGGVGVGYVEKVNEVKISIGNFQ
jgi:hypothetical protein